MIPLLAAGGLEDVQFMVEYATEYMLDASQWAIAASLSFVSLMGIYGILKYFLNNI